MIEQSDKQFHKYIKANAENLFNYEVVQAFNEIVYLGVLTQKDLSSSKEVVIKDVTLFVDDGKDIIEEPRTINNYYYVLQKNMDRYLLQSDLISKLPLKVVDFQKVGWNKEGYKLITSISPVGFTPQKIFTFRDIVDNFAFFNHDNSTHFKLWKIIALSAYLNRINLRVSTEPAFGKDSVIRLLNDLMERIGVIQKPTLAKLEYLTNNKLILVNEFVNLNATETRDIEQYLLTVGDFSNKYQKRSRASSIYQGSEEYDISKISLILAFNNKDCYPADTTYFDDHHSKQIKERFFPVKFKGKLTHNFSRIINAKDVAEENKTFYIAMARSIRYYMDLNNVMIELKDFGTNPYTECFSDRWRINFETIIKYINLYSKDKSEYDRLLGIFYNCHLDYLEMVNKGNKTLNQNFHVKFNEEEPVVDEEYIE